MTVISRSTTLASSSTEQLPSQETWLETWSELPIFIKMADAISYWPVQAWRQACRQACNLALPFLPHSAWLDKFLICSYSNITVRLNISLGYKANMQTTLWLQSCLFFPHVGTSTITFLFDNNCSLICIVTILFIIGVVFCHYGFFTTRSLENIVFCCKWFLWWLVPGMGSSEILLSFPPYSLHHEFIL